LLPGRHRNVMLIYLTGRAFAGHATSGSIPNDKLVSPHSGAKHG
jgi:hypothetical protein